MNGFFILAYSDGHKEKICRFFLLFFYLEGDTIVFRVMKRLQEAENVVL